jgi:hypothetical protein
MYDAQNQNPLLPRSTTEYTPVTKYPGLTYTVEEINSLLGPSENAPLAGEEELDYGLLDE